MHEISKGVFLQDTLVADITTRCNGKCAFCYQFDRVRPQDMPMKDFKNLVNQIKHYSIDTGKKFELAICGGEPFLHPRAEEMIAFAVSELGRDNVSITTNLTTFPKRLNEAIKLLKRIGNPTTHISIDKEHLKNANDLLERLEVFDKATHSVGTKVYVNTLVRSEREAKHPFSAKVMARIPERIRKQIIPEIEFYATPEKLGLYRHLAKTARGRRSTLPEDLQGKLGFPKGLNLKILNVSFAPNGRAYILPGLHAFYSSHLSLGSWTKEPIRHLFEKTLPLKATQLRDRLGLGNKRGITARKKEQLFAKYALKRFKQQNTRRTK